MSESIRAVSGEGEDNPSLDASLDRALRWIGDLDCPFYNDERQRFVWYEASAIAFQLFLFANIGTLGIAAWIGGPGSLPYVIPLFLVQTFVSLVALGYAKRKHAEYTPEPIDFTTGRTTLYMLLLALLASGIARALWQTSTTTSAEGFFGGFVEGARYGAFSVVAGIVVGMIVLFGKARRQRTPEEAQEG